MAEVRLRLSGNSRLPVASHSAAQREIEKAVTPGIFFRMAPGFQPSRRWSVRAAHLRPTVWVERQRAGAGLGCPRAAAGFGARFPMCVRTRGGGGAL
eukprot:4976322-Prymnesium_polylepis.2